MSCSKNYLCLNFQNIAERERRFALVFAQNTFQNKRNTEIMLTNIFFTIHSGVALRKQ